MASSALIVLVCFLTLNSDPVSLLIGETFLHSRYFNLICVFVSAVGLRASVGGAGSSSAENEAESAGA